MDVILHNRPEGTPSDNEFVAYGTPTTPSGQIKMSNFYTLLMTKLGFFKVSNLFSEIFGNPTAMAAARANLGVSGTAENTTALNLKADKTNVIEKDSTINYTPTVGTHPVNKKYVDDKIITGSVAYTEPAGQTTYVALIGKTMPNSSYKVFATFEGNAGAMFAIGIQNKTQTQFDINIMEYGGATQGGGLIHWLIIAY